MRRLVLGDVHGGFRALEQVLERAKYDPAGDRLIFLGDAVDGWPQSREVMQFLMDQENATLLLGNHDDWYFGWLQGDHPGYQWLHQGGIATLNSMREIGEAEDQLIHWRPYMGRVKEWHEEDRLAFMHGGFSPALGVRGTALHPRSKDIFTWDRDVFSDAIEVQKAYDQDEEASDRPPRLQEAYDRVYIGHTSTWSFSQVPVNKCEVWMLDQGGGWEGKLSLMDVDTEEYWQSDVVQELYPGYSHRRSA